MKSKRGFIESIVFITAIGAFIILFIICVMMLFVLKPNVVKGDSTFASIVSSSDLLYDSMLLRTGQTQQWIVLDSRPYQTSMSDLTKERLTQIFKLDTSFCALAENDTDVISSSGLQYSTNIRSVLSSRNYVYKTSCSGDSYVYNS